MRINKAFKLGSELKFTFLLFSIFYQTSLCQTKDSVYRSDCNNCRIIVLENKITKVIGSPLRDSGLISEINFENYPYAFKHEHHTAWYKLKIKVSGWLTFDLVPYQIKDDYDFMLFKADSLNTCDRIQKALSKPIRAVISRNNLKLKSKTGLDSLSIKRFDDEGVGASYCKQIKVNNGEVYYLVVDNVYSAKNGHDLIFKIKQAKTYAIKIRDADSNLILADFSIKDEKGKLIEKIEADSNGSYPFEPNKFAQHYVHLSKVGYFTKVFKVSQTTSELSEDYELNLQVLNTDESYIVNNILFVGNETTLLKESFSAVYGLVDMLKNNPNLKIEIQGHVNENPANKEAATFKLSENRAKRIYDYLISKGIAANRLSWKGFGGELPVYKEYQDETYCKYNRRVVIKVISK